LWINETVPNEMITIKSCHQMYCDAPRWFTYKIIFPVDSCCSDLFRPTGSENVLSSITPPVYTGTNQKEYFSRSYASVHKHSLKIFFLAKTTLKYSWIIIKSNNDEINKIQIKSRVILRILRVQREVTSS